MARVAQASKSLIPGVKLVQGYLLAPGIAATHDIKLLSPDQSGSTIAVPGADHEYRLIGMHAIIVAGGSVDVTLHQWDASTNNPVWGPFTMPVGFSGWINFGGSEMGDAGQQWAGIGFGANNQMRVQIAVNAIAAGGGFHFRLHRVSAFEPT